MHTAAQLLDLDTRAHACLAALLDHCRGFSPDELNRELDGFGYPTVRLQLHHAIGAQEYWIGVLQGRVEPDFDDAAYPGIDELEAWRRRTADLTAAYLRATDEATLNAAVDLPTWGGRIRTLVPAQVVLRTVTHIFHHQGQIAAMCRLLGRPVEGLDWPLT
ncbi:MAG: DinB family protein [Candidatus Krumholzibacteriia bacterium]